MLYILCSWLPFNKEMRQRDVTTTKVFHKDHTWSQSSRGMYDC